MAWGWAPAALLWLALAQEPASPQPEPPRGYEDELLCPPGSCRGPARLKKEERVKQLPKQVCLSAVTKSEKISPRGLGEKLSMAVWTELAKAGWHNITCLEVERGSCPYFPDSAEWTVCRVTSNFLLKTLGELSAGGKKTVVDVRGLLAPYLAGPDAKAQCEPAQLMELQGLWAQVDSATVQRYIGLKLDGYALSRDILNELEQDGFGSLEKPIRDSGKPQKTGLALQEALSVVLLKANWRARYAQGWSEHVVFLALCLGIALLAILMLTFALCRRKAKSGATD
mmetsp:Transcript_90009/g.284970  ORF Transcript_90009/g.284970 Transcript_90009/m.284970 type:complete len:284 (-) Transcript_90009:108-959(-)